MLLTQKSSGSDMLVASGGQRSPVPGRNGSRNQQRELVDIDLCESQHRVCVIVCHGKNRFDHPPAHASFEHSAQQDYQADEPQVMSKGAQFVGADDLGAARRATARVQPSEEGCLLDSGGIRGVLPALPTVRRSCSRWLKDKRQRLRLRSDDRGNREFMANILSTGW